MSQSLIQIRVDKTLKDDASEVFASLGLDISTAVRIFLQRCRTTRGIPFSLTIPERATVKMGVSKGKWNHGRAWYEKDRRLDAELERDFYADSL